MNAPTDAPRRVAELYRTRPGLLLGTALAVFAPLQVPRYLAIDARWYAVAIGLTVVGHLVLAWALARGLGRRDDVAAPLHPAVAALGIVAVTGLQIALGLTMDAVLGLSTPTMTLGGFVPSVLLGPVWALLLVGAVGARRARPAAARV